MGIDGSNGLRNKTKTLSKAPKNVEDLPEWNFDGSSTGQAPGDNSDVYLRPVAIYPDPFRGAPNILVITECWDPDGTPNKYNYRHECASSWRRTRSTSHGSVLSRSTLFSIN